MAIGSDDRSWESGRIEARIGLRMMPTFPRSPLSFRTAGFPQYGWKAGISDGAFPCHFQLKPAPGMRCPRPGLHPSFVHRVVEGRLRSAPEHSLAHAPPWRVGGPPPQGPSLGSRLFCPGPSSLNRPHPPPSWTHRDFTAGRLIRDAFAVRERLGDPRVVPGFRCPFSPEMPSSMTPGSSDIVMVQVSDADMAFAEI